MESRVALRDALLAETAEPVLRREILPHLARPVRSISRDGRWVADSDLRAVGTAVSVRESSGAASPDRSGHPTDLALGRSWPDFDVPLLLPSPQTTRIR